MGPAGSHPSPSVPKVGPPGRAAGWQDSGLHLETLALAGSASSFAPGEVGWVSPGPSVWGGGGQTQLRTQLGDPALVPLTA